MRRVLTVLVGLSMVVAACGDESPLVASTAGGNSPPSTSSETTSGSTEATPAPTQATVPTTTTSTLPTTGLDVLQVLVRYDGRTGLGTFEATVCNRGEAPVEPTVALSAGTGGFRLGSGPLAPNDCADFFDGTVDLAAGFGIAAPGAVPVEVTVAEPSGASETLFFDVEVPMLDASAPPGELQNYRDCLASGQNHRNCVGLVVANPIGDADEIMKVRSRYRTIGPVGHSEILSYMLADNATCTQRIEDWMRTSGPDLIIGRTVVTDDYSGGYSSPYVDIHNLQSEETWQQLVADIDTWWWPVLDGQCGNAHELTHLILGNTPMPHLLNEGLATYMEADDRSGSGRSQAVECYDDHWHGWRYGEGEGDSPYLDLVHWSPDPPGIHYYYSAMCFWDHVVTTYGEDAAREIVSTTAAQRDPLFNGCSSLVGTVLFMRDIVRPILGEDISPVTMQRWGFDETFTGCEG